MKSLLLIADDPAAVQGIRLALRNAGGFRVAATVDGRVSARPSLARLAPDVVVVDEMRRRTDALARLQEATEETPGATTVLLTTSLDTASLDDAFEVGAHAVVSRRVHAARLGMLLHEIAHGTVVHAPRRRQVPHLHGLVDQELRTSA